jgi:plastocyanin domain-containing protein
LHQYRQVCRDGPRTAGGTDQFRRQAGHVQGEAIVKFRTSIAIALSFVVLAAAAGFAQAHKADRKVQTVKLTVGDDGSYVVTPPTVTKGVPVKMEVDLRSVKGCARTVVISAFSVKKTVKEGETTVEFTPNKTGTIEVVCGMNMVTGTFTVTAQ